MKKTRVLWVDQSFRDEVVAMKEKGYELDFPETTARLINTEVKLIALANSGDLGRFDVIVCHMSFNGVTDFLMRWREELLELRLGVLTGEKITIEVEADVIRKFSPDFLANFDDDDFIKKQLARGRITEQERRWRGERVLTPQADFGPEGQLVRRERE